MILGLASRIAMLTALKRAWSRMAGRSEPVWRTR
jgi:hypothetical protein